MKGPRMATTATSPSRRTDVGATRVPVSEMVYDRLLEMIISGHIEPGGRLSVDGLTRHLGVSQTPIRRALGLLEAEGLVTNSYLAGFTATAKLTRTEFDDLFEVRRLFEPASAGLAAARATNEQLAEITTLGEAMRQRGDSGELLDYSAFARLDSQFHGSIIGATQNPTLRRSYDQMHAHVHMFRLLFNKTVTSDAITEHDQIITALAARDAYGAEAAMLTHLESSQRRLAEAFNES
jgi:DNA-binding GntR family transcriptional regulator